MTATIAAFVTMAILTAGIWVIPDVPGLKLVWTGAFIGATLVILVWLSVPSTRRFFDAWRQTRRGNRE